MSKVAIVCFALSFRGANVRRCGIIAEARAIRLHQLSEAAPAWMGGSCQVSSSVRCQQAGSTVYLLSGLALGKRHEGYTPAGAGPAGGGRPSPPGSNQGRLKWKPSCASSVARGLRLLLHPATLSLQQGDHSGYPPGAHRPPGGVTLTSVGAGVGHCLGQLATDEAGPHIGIDPKVARIHKWGEGAWRRGGGRGGGRAHRTVGCSAPPRDNTQAELREAGTQCRAGV